MEKVERPKLEDIPINKSLIDSLYSHGKISLEARRHVLKLLATDRNWGLWASRLLLVLGTTSILAGIIFFFAFNWASFDSILKLSTIQVGIIICLFGASFYSLQDVGGQVLLLAGSILVGVFMAVFGQIYQTGADSYQLFMMWALLIFGWTLLSKFVAQWILLLIVMNLFLTLWWNQDVQYAREMEVMICSYLILLNGCALALREFFAIKKDYAWLQPRWTRIVIALVLVCNMFFPVCLWIFEVAAISLTISGIVGLIGHGIMVFVYRYKLRDMWVLTMTVLSLCILLEVFIGYQIIDITDSFSAGIFFLLGLLTLGIFTVASIYLRNALNKIGAHHE